MSVVLQYNSLEVLKRDLARLPEDMLDWAFDVLMQQAGLMRDLAQVYVNVETGSLRDSIRVERGGEGERWRRVRVRAGGYIVNPRTGKLVNYAHHQEYGPRGRPYMRPAYEQVRGTISQLIQEKIVENVEG